MNKKILGRFLVVFRRTLGPFYMTEWGHLTDDWQDSRTFASATEARNLITDLVHAKPLSKYTTCERRGRRSDEPWDQVFVASARSARIYRIERMSAKRWAANDHVAKLNLDETVTFPEESMASLQMGIPSEEFYNSPQSLWPKDDTDNGNGSADHEANRSSETTASSECISGSISS